MTEKGLKTLRFWYGIALGTLTLAVGVSFIAQTLRIYHGEADSPYDREIVKEMFSQIAVFVWIWLVAAIGGWVIWTLFPEQEKIKVTPDHAKTLERLRKRFSKQRTNLHAKHRIVAWLAATVVCVFCAVIAAVYLFNTNNFPATDGGANVTSEVLKAVWVVLPLAVAAAASCIAASFYSAYSVKKELKETLALLAEVKMTETTESSENGEKKKSKVLQLVNSEKTLFFSRLVVAVIGITLVIVGIWNGGMQDVLAKAIKICTECIGLG